LTKTWTAKGAAYFFGGILGLPIGLYMILALPQAWIFGAFLSVVSLIFILIGLRGRQTIESEKKKPLMDVAT
jgi:uncharacterized membrane protein YfcA